MKNEDDHARKAGMTVDKAGTVANEAPTTAADDDSRPRHNNPNWPSDSPPYSNDSENFYIDYRPDELPRDRQIAYVLARLSEFLQAKNAGYGDSALAPISIFSKHGLGRPGDGIYSRLDEKLQRIANANAITKNDLADVLGYLVLLCIKHRFFDFEDLLDY